MKILLLLPLVMFLNFIAPQSVSAKQVLYHASGYTSTPCGDIICSIDILYDDETGEIYSWESCCTDPCNNDKITFSGTAIQDNGMHVTGIKIDPGSCSDQTGGRGCNSTIYTSEYQNMIIDLLNSTIGR